MITRRQFLLSTTSALLLNSVSQAAMPSAHPGGSDRLRVGLVGCGNRGRHDLLKFAEAERSLKLVAISDVFPENLESGLAYLEERIPGNVEVSPEACFTGFDGYKGLLQTDVDVVLFATPPWFRPLHFQAAIEAGKHVFLEKPIAVDPFGVHSVLKTAELANQKRLKVVVGTQMRRAKYLMEGMQKIHDGALGTIHSGACFRIDPAMTGWGPEQRLPEWNDIAWQIRRWYFIAWLSGDFIVENAIHSIDMMNWAMGGHPERCFGLGGRQSRTDALYGDVFDHMAIEYVYPGGARVQYQGAKMDGVSHRLDHRVHGTKGSAEFDYANFSITGENAYKYAGALNDPERDQFRDLAAAIREDQPLNEAARVAESSMTAIMGRMSAYTGRAISWNWAMKASKLRLGPEDIMTESYPLPEPAQPGITALN